MKNVVIAAAICAAALTAAPAVTDAETNQSPIAVTSVQVQAAGGTFNVFFPGMVSVVFENRNQKPVTEVVFGVGADGEYEQPIHDVGTFTQGVSFRHSFVDWDANPNQHVNVLEVFFADGSTWERETPAPRARRQSTVSAAPHASGSEFLEGLLSE